MRVLRYLFGTSGFPPRWECGTAWEHEPLLGWFHVLSDVTIFLAYVCIPLLLIYFLRKQEIKFPKIAFLFSAFIFCCGTVHLIEAGIFWWPAYRLSAAIKVLTAGVSLATVFALIPAIPVALTMKSHRELEEEIDRRTNELTQANELLRRNASNLLETRSALEQSESQFRRIYENAAVGIALVSEEGRWLHINDSLCSLVGYDRDQLTHMTFQEITHPDDLETDLGLVTQMLEGRIDSYSMDKRYIRQDRSVVWVNLSVSLIADAGETKTFIAIIRDISDRKTAEHKAGEINQELEALVGERTAKLVAANEELASFSYSVSHDLRAPIRHIIGFGQLLERKLGPTLEESGKKLLDTMTSSAKRAGQLIDALLSLSRASRVELKFEEIDLNQTINTVRENLPAELGGRPCEWNIEQLPTVHGDQTLVLAALQNLIENAIKFTPADESPIITITADQGSEQTTICVSDQGSGFEMKYADNLFVPFQRLHDLGEYPGTGIGLAMVKRIVARHSGRVWAEGKPNEGATFFVSIPRQESGNNDGRDPADSVS